MPAEEPWARHTIDNASRGADGVKLADVNGDGRLDMVTGWEEGARFAFVSIRGQRETEVAGLQVGAVKSPEDAVLVDLDGDGRLDVVSSTGGDTRTVCEFCASGALWTRPLGRRRHSRRRRKNRAGCLPSRLMSTAAMAST